jgi:CP family cyanate transporter-like MFS transporter
MGLQSFIFFTLIAWLPDMLIFRGLTAGKAGVIISLMQVVGLIGTFLAPLVAVRFREQKKISVALGMGYTLGFLTFFSESMWLIYLGLSMVGFCLGASISMAYTLIGLRTKGKNTAALSGMSQSLGYYFASIGPLLVGMIFDIAVNWILFILLLVICSLAFAYLGSKVGRDLKV